MTWLPLNWSQCYADSYSENLYRRLARKLEKREQETHPNTLVRTNLLLLYIEKCDGSEAALFKGFGTEALLVPLEPPDGFVGRFPVTKNQREQAANDLIRVCKRAIRRVRGVLSVIAEEVTNRDSKTCLLLPPKNFGRDIDKVFGCVRDACLHRQEAAEFQRRLDRTFQALRKFREGRRTYVVGRNGLVFKSPGKAGARHGLSPVWGDQSHDSTCVIRGRIRFGAPYDPKFHYDCNIPDGSNRKFSSCDGSKRLPRNRGRVNMSSNDNIR